MNSRTDRNWLAESDIREAREDRKRHGRTREQARELWQQAAKSAAICGKCFRPLSPMDSVTMEYRKIGKHYSVRVPVCLLCTLDAIKESFFECRYQRARCRNCGRPIRVRAPLLGRGAPLSLNARTCCADCKRLAKNKRNKLRRHVTQEPKRCANPACGKIFVPTRADAVTCSGRCRQALHRERARAELGDRSYPLRKTPARRERRGAR